MNEPPAPNLGQTNQFAADGPWQAPKLYGVFGDPISHSLSPLMHNKAFAATAFAGIYLPFRVGSIRHAVAAMRALDMRGASVTLPHKISVMSHLDRIDAGAQKIGAVNTISNQDGILSGHNSDAVGAVLALKEQTEIRDRRVAIIGAGGAARAIGFGLRTEQATVTIVNRNLDRGEQLAADLDGQFVPLSESVDVDCDILINATPVGMQPNAAKTPVHMNIFKKGMLVMDAIYTPRQTRFLKEAAAAGCETIDGLPMFVHQGACQFELWTGLKAPVAVMRAAVASALGGGHQGS